MKLKLKYKDKTVLVFDAVVGPYVPTVISSEIICPELLPEILKNSEGEYLEQKLTAWLEWRTIPNMRHDIDDSLLRLYQLNFGECGRLYPYQHIGALLTHYSSFFDHYIVDVDSLQYLYFGLEEPCIKNLWILTPSEYNTPSHFHPQTKIDMVLAGKEDFSGYYSSKNYASFSFSIPSIFPSWWEEKDNKIFLCQKLYTREIEWVSRVLPLLKKYSISDSFINGNMLYTDYSKLIDIDTTWIVDFLYNEKYEKSDLSWDSFIIQEFPEFKNIITRLKNFYDDCCKQDLPVALSKMGIAKRNAEYFPIVIL